MTRSSGSRPFAEMIRDYGVSHMFFVPAFGLCATRHAFREAIAHALTLDGLVVIDAVTDVNAFAQRAWAPAAGGAGHA